MAASEVSLSGSMLVPEQLPTYPYPSPKPTSTLACYHLTAVGLGEELVCGCSATDIDPYLDTLSSILLFYKTTLKSHLLNDITGHIVIRSVQDLSL